MISETARRVIEMGQERFREVDWPDRVNGPSDLVSEPYACECGAWHRVYLDGAGNRQLWAITGQETCDRWRTADITFTFCNREMTDDDWELW